MPLPGVLGHEIAGEVVEFGPGVEEQMSIRVPSEQLRIGTKACLLLTIAAISAHCCLGLQAVGAFIMPCGSCARCAQGREDMCEPFFKHSRGKGVLYDGTTRKYRCANRCIGCLLCVHATNAMLTYVGVLS